MSFLELSQRKVSLIDELIYKSSHFLHLFFLIPFVLRLSCFMIISHIHIVLANLFLYMISLSTEKLSYQHMLYE